MCLEPSWMQILGNILPVGKEVAILIQELQQSSQDTNASSHLFMNGTFASSAA